MPSDWKELMWGDIATLEYGKALRTYQECNGKYPVYGTNGLIGWHERPLYNGEGVIIGRKGAYRGVHYSRAPFFVIDTAFYLKPKIKDLDMRFAYYELLTHDINSMDSGSAIPSTSRPEFYNLTVQLPPFEEQKLIGHILGTFDDKIQLNKQLNTTLEAIGQAVFKSYFVDFEFPNEEGKPYKSSGGQMVESPLGEIPRGWKTGGLGDISEITMGQSPPGETYNEICEGVPFFQGIRDFGFRFPSKRVYCTAPTRFAQEGDVLLSVRAPVGSLNIAKEPLAIGRGVASLRLKEKQNGFLYYLLLATRSAWDEFEAKGTVFGSATKQDVNDFKTIIPTKELRDKFGELVKPIDQKILLNEKESITLMSIRDSLLPKLMSGKIRVPVNTKNMEAL